MVISSDCVVLFRDYATSDMKSQSNHVLNFDISLITADKRAYLKILRTQWEKDWF